MKHARRYYVKINEIYMYDGYSGDKAASIYKDALVLIRSLRGTGEMWYYTPESMGSFHFTNGQADV